MANPTPLQANFAPSTQAPIGFVQQPYPQDGVIQVSLDDQPTTGNTTPKTESNRWLKPDYCQVFIGFILLVLVVFEQAYMSSYHFTTRWERGVEETFYVMSRAKPLLNVAFDHSLLNGTFKQPLYADMPAFNICPLADSTLESGKVNFETQEEQGSDTYPNPRCIYNPNLESFFDVSTQTSTSKYTNNCPYGMKTCGRNMCVDENESCPIKSLSFITKYEKSDYEEYVSFNDTHGFGVDRTNETSPDSYWNELSWITGLKLSVGQPCLSEDRDDLTDLKEAGLEFIYPSKTDYCIMENGENYKSLVSWPILDFIDASEASKFNPKVRSILSHASVTLYAVTNIQMDFGAYDSAFDDEFYHKIQSNYDSPFITYEDIEWLLYVGLGLVVVAFFGAFFKCQLFSFIVLLVCFVPKIGELNWALFTISQTKNFQSLLMAIAYNVLNFSWSYWAVRVYSRLDQANSWEILIYVQFVIALIWITRMIWTGCGLRRKRSSTRSAMRLNLRVPQARVNAGSTQTPVNGDTSMQQYGARTGEFSV